MPASTVEEGSRGTESELFHETDAEWRTVRQSREAANSEKTARAGAPQRRSLPEPHARSQGDRGRSSDDSLHSGSAEAWPKHPRSPSGRLRTATGGTATLETATKNGETAPTATTVRKGRSPRTAWELRELIRPLPTRRTARRKTATAHRAFDPALVEWVYQSRFCLTSQLHRRFPEQLPTIRTAQRHVARLIDAKLLATAPVRSTGPNFPAVVYATGRSIRLIRETYSAHGREWDEPQTEERKAKGLALDSVLHEILVSEIDLAMHRTTEQRDDLQLLSRERRYFRRDRQLVYQQQGRRRSVVPDAGYLAAIRDANGWRTLPLMFLELENGTHTAAKIRRKLQRYTRWAEAAGESYLRNRTHPHYKMSPPSNFRLLIVAHDKYGTVSDKRRLLDLLIQAMELPRPMRDRIWLARADDLWLHQHTPAPIDAPVWYRARDTRQWMGEYQRLKQPGSVAKRRNLRQEREFVASRICELPKRALFPSHQSSA